MTKPVDPLAELEGEGELKAGGEIYAFAERAYPTCRSITGDGVRETLRLLQEEMGDGAQLDVHEVPTGTQVFDWQVPKEWNVRGAWIDGPGGKCIVDFADHNLHLLNYSVPFRGTLSLEELKPHLYSDPERPTAIPYRTSYYQERWGFCLPHEQLEELLENDDGGDYEVVVDTTLEDGHLTYGEVVLPGESDEIVLLSAHVCHPSLANDNLSALGVAAHLARRLATIPQRRYTYRIVFAPGTIGAIVWLARNEEVAARVRHGLVLANLGDGGNRQSGAHGMFHYKRSRRENAIVDRAVLQVLGDAGEAFEVEDFSPFGYDERQYGSPGFDLPVGSLAQTPWGRYPEYHSSDDNLDLIRPEHLGRSLHRLLEVVHLLEHDRTFRNLNPQCEPQLGSRGLYGTLGGGDEGRERQLALLWVLNQSDGTNSLLDIAERSGKPFHAILEAATALVEADLLEKVG